MITEKSSNAVYLGINQTHSGNQRWRMETESMVLLITILLRIRGLRQSVKNLRSRSPKKTALAWREIALIGHRFDDFERLSAVRFQKLMGQA